MSQFIPYGNPGLFDDFIQTLDVQTFETPLARVGKLIEWKMFKKTVHSAVLSKPKGPGGRPRFEPLLMFKILILQRLHGLADDDTCFQITDRNSFRAFLGITPADLVPDGQTIRDFREALIAAKSFDELFQTFLTHLQTQHGLALAKQGVIVDATFAEVPRQHNTPEENASIKAGEVPASMLESPKRLAHKDTDARWTKKNEQSYYGYKNHVKADVTDKIIMDCVVTSASVHDSQALEQLVNSSDQKVFADSAYSSEEIAAKLKEIGVEAYINEKGQRNHPLTVEQKELNKSKSKIRSRVEHLFGHMTGSMNALYQRYIGMERNEACLKMTNLVYNMMRFEQIVRLRLA
jgi:transposase, IS5 family